MLNISLELPPGVAPPAMRGILTGPPEDLRIEIRLADFVAAIKQAQTAGATVTMVPHGVVIEEPAPPPADPPKPEHPIAASVRKTRAAVSKKTAGKAAKLKPSGTVDETSVPSAGPYVPSPGSVPYNVLRELAKSPASSLELTNKLGQDKSAAIYQAVKFLREKGLVEGFEDEFDGTRRWRLCAK